MISYPLGSEMQAKLHSDVIVKKLKKLIISDADSKLEIEKERDIREAQH